MDPQTAFYRWVQATQDGSLDDAAEHAEALQGWISKGGFLPVDDQERFVHSVAVSTDRYLISDPDPQAWVDAFNIDLDSLPDRCNGGGA